MYLYIVLKQIEHFKQLIYIYIYTYVFISKYLQMQWTIQLHLIDI